MKLTLTRKYYTPTLLTGEMNEDNVVGMQEHWIGASWGTGKGLYSDRIWNGRDVIAMRDNE